jgi:hypothetical protein
MYHINVYQGKKTSNMHVLKEARNLPTAQKAVANAILSSGINNDPEGMGEFIWMIKTQLLKYVLFCKRKLKS